MKKMNKELEEVEKILVKKRKCKDSRGKGKRRLEKYIIYKLQRKGKKFRNKSVKNLEEQKEEY